MNKAITIIMLSILMTGSVEAQQRDRRSDLVVPCGSRIDVSNTGRLWMADRCGHVWTAENIHSSWQTVMKPDDERHTAGTLFERVAAFGHSTAVAAGYLQPGGFVLRTTTSGLWWDTVRLDPALTWVHGFCFHPDGHLWIASASGREYEDLVYSVDSGRTFTLLTPPFANPDEENNGIESLCMMSADSGFAGTYGNRLYSTSDNWKTAHRIATPMDQGVLVERTYQSLWINKIQPWKRWLIVTESDVSAYTSLDGEPAWQPMPFGIGDYQADGDVLWAIGDSGRVLLMTDMEHVQTFDLNAVSIIGVVEGHLYCNSSDGVLRIAPDGQVDTCGFYTTEHPIEEPRLTLGHGTRLWGSDGSSIYILDAQGWYRVAKPLGVQSIHADPDKDDRIIFLRADGQNYTIDTAGHVSSYVYPHPLTPFAKSGVQCVEILTYSAGCYHYRPQTVRYRRVGTQLREEYNDVDSNSRDTRLIPAATVEEALVLFGDRYSLFPTHADFGMEDTSVNLRQVFDRDGFWSTNSVGYLITIVNGDGDTLFARGRTSPRGEIDGSTRYPWMLPMEVSASGVDFISYQPKLWQTLRSLMPQKMFLREYLDNSSLRPHLTLQSGDLLFSRRNRSDKENAICESTGQYSHVAMVEVDSAGRYWIIEATPGEGVRRIAFSNHSHAFHYSFDIYRLAQPFDTAAVIARAKGFLGQEYDETYLPDNGKLYCSELVYECFLDTDGKHLFEAKPMNWRDKKGKMPKYWKKHFKKLKMSIPEGVPGTNPTDLSRSPLLRKL